MKGRSVLNAAEVSPVLSSVGDCDFITRATYPFQKLLPLTSSKLSSSTEREEKGRMTFRFQKMNQVHFQI